MAASADTPKMHETPPGHATTAAEPRSDHVDARARRTRRRLLLWLLPILLLGLTRAVLTVHDLGVLVAVFIWIGVLLFVAALLGAISATYRRGVRKLARLAGPGAWAAWCVDAQRPELWRAVVADSGGVRLVGDRRGALVAAWPWAEITDVTVQRARVADRQGNTVVLHLRDGSTVSLAFLVLLRLGYPRRRAEAVAHELRRRALGAAAASAPAPPAPPAARQLGADAPVPTPLPGPSAGRLQVRGYLLVGVALLLLLPSIPFEHYLPGGARTELLTFIPVGGLFFAVGCAVVFAGMHKGRREIDRGYTTNFQTAGWDQALFLLDWRDLSVLSGPFEPRPDKLPRRRQPAGD